MHVKDQQWKQTDFGATMPKSWKPQQQTAQPSVLKMGQTWKTYWAAQGELWRTEAEIDVSRQQILTDQLHIQYADNELKHPFKQMHLNRADLEWLIHLLPEQNTLNLEGVVLNRVQLRSLPLKRANFTNARLERADFFGAELEGAIFVDAELEGTFFTHVKLEGANFLHAKTPNHGKTRPHSSPYPSLVLMRYNERGTNFFCTQRRVRRRERLLWLQ